MTRLAFARKCGGLGARGLSARPVSFSAASSSEIIPGSSNDPPTSERSMLRRLQLQVEYFTGFDPHNSRFNPKSNDETGHRPCSLDLPSPIKSLRSSGKRISEINDTIWTVRDQERSP